MSIVSGGEHTLCDFCMKHFSNFTDDQLFRSTAWIQSRNGEEDANRALNKCLLSCLCCQPISWSSQFHIQPVSLSTGRILRLDYSPSDELDYW